MLEILATVWLLIQVIGALAPFAFLALLITIAIVTEQESKRK